ncbi:hypothetical protein DI270_031695 [Microbispora triticiradicis]|uniref:Uncharacterized protein n=3 Tax=Microbispora TaxID=2005 RepID=A0ABY3M6B6_9ACTN|nr:MULTISPECIES: DUF6412 domain-containing protein [Microbispora]RGA01037.1 hypothetical protein DI270_031695 [Microbispora triticiradicis]TLP66455.1 hypothetical protein FED44_03010 [Microbispora fusca]TYB68239.1 hypothetical protein FXF59_01750 [Microbispora tritici]GLW23958.1 hypothetical protein Mame01_40010 [Microbispora amethystogenes]
MNALQAAVTSLVRLLAELVIGLAGGSAVPSVVAFAGVAGVAVLVFAWMLSRLTGVPAVVRGPGRRSYDGETAMVRLRDPGAPGRPRPRAPSGSLALA